MVRLLHLENALSHSENPPTRMNFASGHRSSASLKKRSQTSAGESRFAAAGFLVKALCRILTTKGFFPSQWIFLNFEASAKYWTGGLNLGIQPFLAWNSLICLWLMKSRSILRWDQMLGQL